MTTNGIAIISSGSATPDPSLNNSNLSQIVDTSDEWIASRTGIHSRRLASPELNLSDLATTAAENALKRAEIKPDQIDLIILATSTPDDLFGSASQIQANLGASQAVAFDLTVACSGFVFGLVTAAQFIQNGVYQTVLLIGADILSRWVDWSDRRTCVLFGDGAGAVILQRSQQNNLLGFELRNDGRQNACLNVSYQPSPKTLTENCTISQGNYQAIAMNGKEVYRFAVKKVPEVIEKALYRAHLTADEIDWLILHQANQRIINAVAERLNLPAEKVVSNLANYGNTSAASIPLALDEAVESGRVQPGDIIATSGFGAGLSWGAAIFRWG
ncbi:MAG: beta-ketoacyl-ACP synthase III [Microcoleaceae cyanobacterium]